MGLIFALLAGGLGGQFAAVVARGRREWRDGDVLSRTSSALISVTWLLATATLATALAWRPLALGDVPTPILALGLVLVVAGAALAVPGYLPFASLKQLYGVERGGLITDGVYRYSRNPQYAGIGLMFTGAAVIAGSPAALGVAGAYWVGVSVWVAVEEDHLRASFGDDYDAYQSRAPRFLGLP